MAGQTARALRLRTGARIHGLLGGRPRRAAEPRPPALGAAATITLRLAGPGERAAVERLAELSSRVAPSGRYLVAEVDGDLWAALPLSGGEPVADPFLPALEVKALLLLRAAQLEAGETARPRQESAGAAPVLSPGRAC